MGTPSDVFEYLPMPFDIFRCVRIIANVPYNSRVNAYKVYILSCEDGSLYTGITTDVDRRFEEHRSGGPKAARYTRSHRAVSLEGVWDAGDRAEAGRLEFRIKQLSHAEKLKLIADPDSIERLREQ